MPPPETLLGTSWRIAETPNMYLATPNTATYNLSFRTGANTSELYLTLRRGPTTDYQQITYAPGGGTVFSGGTWTNQNYRVVHISGGTDVASAILINWFNNNAVQISDDYVVTYNSMGGSYVPPYSGSALPTPLPTPTRVGYTFIGWYYNMEYTQAAHAGDTLTEDVTLYASWIFIGYRITYDSRGGSAVPSSSGLTLPDPLPESTRDGYVLLGWALNAPDGPLATPGQSINTDTTLYAVWQWVGYTITYETNGGQAIPEDHSTELPTPLPVPVRSGYTFSGWYYNSELTQPATAGDVISSNVTLYAKWITSSTTINIDDLVDKLSEGTHTLKASAIGSGYIDSDLSDAITYIVYAVTNTVLNGYIRNVPAKMGQGQSITLYLDPAPGYARPATISVAGVTGTSGSTSVTWDYVQSTGRIRLSNPTNSFLIAANCIGG